MKKKKVKFFQNSTSTQKNLGNRSHVLRPNVVPFFAFAYIPVFLEKLNYMPYNGVVFVQLVVG